MATGLAALEDAIATNAATGGRGSGRLGYFNLKPGEEIVLRFLTDLEPDALTVDFYEFIQDNKDKPQNFVVRPDLLEDPDATDYVIEYGGQQMDYQTKELEDPYPKRRTVAIAVVRKEVATDVGKARPVLTYKDDWKEIETKDGKFEARQFIIVKQAYKNFWQQLVGYYHEYGTLCDRDYKIKRTTGGKDTAYAFFPKDPDPDWDYETDASYKALHAYYGYGTGKNAEGEDLTKDSPDRFAYCPRTLQQWAEDMCSEERVKFFLGPLEDRLAKEKGEDKDEDSKPKSSKAKAKSSRTDDDGDEAQAAPPPTNASRQSLEERLAAHR